MPTWQFAPSPARERRCRLIGIHPSVLLDLLRPDSRTRLTYPELPPDVEFVAATVSFEAGSIRLIVASAEWEPVPLGEQFPLLGSAMIETVDLETEQ